MHELTWQKSSHSAPGENACVELAAAESTLALRESDEPTAVLHTHRPQLAAFLRHIKAHATSARP